MPQTKPQAPPATLPVMRPAQPPVSVVFPPFTWGFLAPPPAPKANAPETASAEPCHATAAENSERAPMRPSLGGQDPERLGPLELQPPGRSAPPGHPKLPKSHSVWVLHLCDGLFPHIRHGRLHCGHSIFLQS